MEPRDLVTGLAGINLAINPMGAARRAGCQKKSRQAEGIEPSLVFDWARHLQLIDRLMAVAVAVA